LLDVADILQDFLGLSLGDPFFALTACVLEQGALKRADTSFWFLALRLLQYDVLDLGLLGIARMAWWSVDHEFLTTHGLGFHLFLRVGHQQRAFSLVLGHLDSVLGDV
jgi:hypothetical protein